MMSETIEAAAPADAAAKWQDEIIVRMFKLMHSFEPDNFDAVRYRGESPTAFYYERHAAYFSFFLRNVREFHLARSLLGDAESRELFDLIVLFRTLGHMHVRLPFNTPEMRARAAVPDTWKLYDTPDAGMFGPLALFSVPTAGPDIAVKCWKENIEATFLTRPYYFERGGVRVAPSQGDHVIDAGACFGDTALAFAQSVGEAGRVYSFDPLPKHFEIMRENFAMNPSLAPSIAAFDVGLAAENHRAATPDAANGVINPGANVFNFDVSTRTIDSLVDEGALPRVDFVKMDIEGSELGALKGAEVAIRKWKPRLAISLYHRREDLFTIPLWIDGLDCGYRFFLDHYSIHHEETVLYAVA
jgi:FkbM family methyltransferase